MKIKKFIKQSNIYFVDGYRANKIIFIILAIITKVYNRKSNIRVKIAMVLYIVNHNKFINKIYLLLTNFFIWFMFFTKYDTEYLNSFDFEDISFQKLNEIHYNNEIKYNTEYYGYDLKKHSFFIFWCLYFYYNRLYFWYTIEDEILDTNLDYEKYKYYNFDKDLNK